MLMSSENISDSKRSPSGRKNYDYEEERSANEGDVSHSTTTTVEEGKRIMYVEL